MTNRSKLTRRLGALALTAALLTGVFTLGAGAAGATGVTAQLSPNLNIVVDGVRRDFYTVNGDEAHPIAYNGTTYLPIRAIGELMGKTVSWDGATGTVTLASDSLVTDADTFEPSTGGTTGTVTGALTADQAEAAALAHAGLTAGQVTALRCKSDREDGRLVYEVEFYTAGAEYDYEIDAASGKVVSFDYEARGWTAQDTSGGLIGLERAKEIALAQVPGAASSNIRKAYQDRDDGQVVYEVELVYNGMEYDLEIDGYSGQIRSWDGELLRY